MPGSNVRDFPAVPGLGGLLRNAAERLSNNSDAEIPAAVLNDVTIEEMVALSNWLLAEARRVRRRLLWTVGQDARRALRQEAAELLALRDGPGLLLRRLAAALRVEAEKRRAAGVAS